MATFLSLPCPSENPIERLSGDQNGSGRIFRPWQHPGVNVASNDRSQSVGLLAGPRGDKHNRAAVRRHGKLRDGNRGVDMRGEHQPVGWVHRQANEVARLHNRPAPDHDVTQGDRHQCGRRDPRDALLRCAARASVLLRNSLLIRCDVLEKTADVCDALPAFIRVTRKAAFDDVV